MSEGIQIILAIVINYVIVHMIVATEAAKVKRMADWAKKSADYYENHPPTPNNRLN